MNKTTPVITRPFQLVISPAIANLLNPAQRQTLDAMLADLHSAGRLPHKGDTLRIPHLAFRAQIAAHNLTLLPNGESETTLLLAPIDDQTSQALPG